jgi:hypothetical protein
MIENHENEEFRGFLPPEELRIENEVLKLKMNAMFGAKFPDSEEEMPPQLENIFLNQMLQFETAWAEQTPVTMFEAIGSPSLPPTESLDEVAIKKELSKIYALFQKHNISLSFQKEQPVTTVYKFITEELMKVTMLPMVPGMFHMYMYEEFHPDHKADIEAVVKQFIEGYFTQEKDECMYLLEEQLVGKEKDAVSKEEVSARLEMLFETYLVFANTNYAIEEVKFCIEEGEGAALVKGIISYEGLLEHGERVPFKGKFGIHLNYDYMWKINGFFLPPLIY